MKATKLLWNYSCTIVQVIFELMSITVDPSVIIAVVLNEPSKPSLLEITRRQEMNSAPSLGWEVGNALSALCKRGRISIDQASDALSTFQMIPLRLAEIDISSSLTLAARNGIYAYDAYIIECARKYRTPLLTLDNLQRGVAESLGVDTIEIQS